MYYKSIIKVIPSIITISGLFIVNYCLFFYYYTNNFKYIILMILGLSCDFFDGYLARKFKVVSKIGNILDGFVDKINQLSILIVLTKKYNISKKFTYLFLFKEILLGILRIFKLKKKYSNFYGKLKTFIFPVTILLYHFNNNFKEKYISLLMIYNYLTLVF